MQEKPAAQLNSCTILLSPWYKVTLAIITRHGHLSVRSKPTALARKSKNLERFQFSPILLELSLLLPPTAKLIALEVKSRTKSNPNTPRAHHDRCPLLREIERDVYRSYR